MVMLMLSRFKTENYNNKKNKNNNKYLSDCVSATFLSVLFLLWLILFILILITLIWGGHGESVFYKWWSYRNRKTNWPKFTQPGSGKAGKWTLKSDSQVHALKTSNGLFCINVTCIALYDTCACLSFWHSIAKDLS